MELAATFYISIYGLTALAGGILAWAEQIPSVTALTAPIAIAALFLNERYHVLRLNGYWSGLVGLLAFIYPTYEFFAGNEESRLLAGAHLLTILQWVLLFYHKRAHQYWYLCAISCLQIALASVLTSSPMFGLLILAYMSWALWTLSVFTLLLARLRYGRGEGIASEPGGWGWPELDTGIPAPVRPSNALASAVAASDFRSSFQCDPHETDINWRFILGVGGMSSAALLLGLIFFLLTPRLWIGGSPFQDVGLDATARNLTGFSEKVQLGDFGRILESSAPVLELELTDEQSGKPIGVQTYLSQIGQDEPLLRGVVLGNYDKGEWFPLRAPPPSHFPRRKQFRNRSGRERQYVCQTIRLEPIGTRSIFSLADPEYGFIEEQMGEILISPLSRTLQRTSEGGVFRGAIRYKLFVPKRRGTEDRPLYQVRPEIVDGTSIDADRDRFLELGRQRIASAYLECSQDYRIIHDLAERLVQRTQAALAPANPTPAQLANDIVAYLRDSGEYLYSLDQSRQDLQLDPVEDFLKNRKAGHCQYFATALALLLRASGIPSRVVTGFKGGIEASAAGLLEVQQRHAHAWVEAYLDGEWTTLDATPSAREESVAAIGERVRWYHQIFSFASALWSDYVVNLSFSKQQRDLYAPLQTLANAFTNQIRGTSNFWQVLQKNLVTFWQHPEQWFSLRGGLTAFVLMLSLLGLFYLSRGGVRLIRRLLLGPTDQQKRRVYIEFYERFLMLLKPLGLVPKPDQTQLEFALQVEAAWKARHLPSEFLPIAKDISTAFYRLRFGNETLGPAEEQRLRDSLQQLEVQLRQ